MLFLKVSKQIENIIRNVQFVIFNLQDLEIEFGFKQNTIKYRKPNTTKFK